MKTKEVDSNNSKIKFSSFNYICDNYPKNWIFL